ncbi:MAG: hypothetical protein JNM68_05005 [Dinghuibacter sp.]|nr:hypothetical protein [Dinghuibacter sp.]
MRLLTEILQHVIVVVEILSAITALSTFSKWKGTDWRYFIFYLCFIAVAESIGWLLRENGFYTWLWRWYTYGVIPAEFLFFFWFFYKLMPVKRVKRLAMVAAISFVVAFILEAFKLKDLTVGFLPNNYLVGNIFLLVFIFMYLNHLTNEQHIVTMYYDFGFWFSLILMMFYMLTCPFYGFINILGKTKSYSLLLNTTLLLNILMYLSFSIALIWSKPKPNSKIYR